MGAERDLSWRALPVGERLLERAGLQIPPTARDGTYQLIAGLYDPTSEDAARLIALDGSDFVELGKVTIEPNSLFAVILVTAAEPDRTIADSKRLIDNEYLRIDADRRRKRQPDIHSA